MGPGADARKPAPTPTPPAHQLICWVSLRYAAGGKRRPGLHRGWSTEEKSVAQMDCDEPRVPRGAAGMGRPNSWGDSSQNLQERFLSEEMDATQALLRFSSPSVSLLEGGGMSGSPLSAWTGGAQVQ